MPKSNDDGNTTYNIFNNEYVDEYGRHWHWVNGDGRRRGYWRRVPWTYFHPSPAQAEVQAAFAVTAHTKGMVQGTDTDASGKVIPSNAVVMQREMTDYKSKNPKHKEASPPTTKRLIVIRAPSAAVTETVRNTLKRLLAETR